LRDQDAQSARRLPATPRALFPVEERNRSNDQGSSRNWIRLRFLQREKLACVNAVIAKLDPGAGHVLIVNQVGTHRFAIYDHGVDHAISPPQLAMRSRVKQVAASQSPVCMTFAILAPIATSQIHTAMLQIDETKSRGLVVTTRAFRAKTAELSNTPTQTKALAPLPEE